MSGFGGFVRGPPEDGFGDVFGMDLEGEGGFETGFG